MLQIQISSRLQMEVREPKFKCSQCGLKFLFENTLLLHTQNIHKNSDLSLVMSSVESNVRRTVGERISIVVGLEQTAPTNISPPKRKEMFFVQSKKGHEKCSQCSFMTRNLTLLLEHKLLEHRTKAAPIFYCGYPTCWFPFSAKRKRDEHEKAEHGSLAPPPFFCRICKKRFTAWGPKQLKHYEICMKKMLFKCPCTPSCPFQTKRHAALEKHVQTIHFQSLARYSREQYEVKAGDCQVKQEELHVKMESQLQEKKTLLGSGEYFENEGDHDDLRLSLEGARGSVCPFDQKKFSSTESLHRHLHAAHLDTGSDSLDCPLGQDSLHCFCGRETNCRHSLVIHVSRCGLNNSAEGMRSHVVVDDPEAGSLATMRKAARRCRELGIKDRPSQEELLKRAQMKMCQQLSDRHSRDRDIEEENQDDPEESEDEVEDDSQSEVEEEARFNLNLTPAKRKSVAVSSQPRKMKKRGSAHYIL